jgi:hypothetical protein
LFERCRTCRTMGEDCCPCVFSNCFDCGGSTNICAGCNYCINCDIWARCARCVVYGADCCSCLDVCLVCGVNNDSVCIGCFLCVNCDDFARCSGCGLGLDCCIC